MKIESKFFQNNGAVVSICVLGLSTLMTLGQTNSIPNRLIDYNAFLTGAAEVGRLRAEHRVTEDKFIEMSAEPGTVIFDARSDDKYARLHIKGAQHLSFPEITADTLARLFPNKGARILIYCNNNFLNAPDAFPAKCAAASLNIHTFNTLYNYGYTNVYELGPLIDVKKAKLQFEGASIQAVPPSSK
jgi:phage shock protein E